MLDDRNGCRDSRTEDAPVSANEIAQELGNNKVANMVALGAFIGLTKVISLASAEKALEQVLPARHHRLIPLNVSALERGIALVK